MGEISVKTGNNARNGGKNSLNRLIRCVCGKKIGPDPRNFNQRVSLGRNDLLIRTFPSAIELAITAMEDLINDYDREHTKFSGCHPRQGHASTLRQMQQIHKALKRGRT
uniref:hypothetical protein n=2 Tax=Klebsiella pneumoniae TaxID=573 RepID=UPI002364019A|nr:hypothetical protein [Klebsiella pneumoniae]